MQEIVSFEDKKEYVFNRYVQSSYDKFTGKNDFAIPYREGDLFSVKYQNPKLSYSSYQYDVSVKCKGDVITLIFQIYGTSYSKTLLLLLDDDKRISSEECIVNEGEDNYSSTEVVFAFNLVDLYLIALSKKIEYKISPSVTGIFPDDAVLKFKIIFFSVYSELIKKTATDGNVKYDEVKIVEDLYEQLNVEKENLAVNIKDSITEVENPYSLGAAFLICSFMCIWFYYKSEILLGTIFLFFVGGGLFVLLNKRANR